MLYAKENLPYEKYEDAFGELWQFLWREHKDVSKPEVLAECLGRHFEKEDVERSECYLSFFCREGNGGQDLMMWWDGFVLIVCVVIKAGTDPKYKKMLTDETAMLVEKGAFGAPWWLVTNKEGVEEPFFGSDRYVFSVVVILFGLESWKIWLTMTGSILCTSPLVYRSRILKSYRQARRSCRVRPAMEK